MERVLHKLIFMVETNNTVTLLIRLPNYFRTNVTDGSQRPVVYP